MCVRNSEEVRNSFLGWWALFPDGVPDIFMPGRPQIDRSSLKAGKGNATRSLCAEITSNASDAPKEESFQKKDSFTSWDV